MTVAYELAMLGKPTNRQATDVRTAVEEMIAPYDLRLGETVRWSESAETFHPANTRAAAALFFGGHGVDMPQTLALQSQYIPIIPVVSDLRSASSELPEALRGFNAVEYAHVGPQRVATALLECAGLLPRQRRIFVSYNRSETRAAAVQLFEELSARLFDVFLDTHGVSPGSDFQAVLWHRLCDSDVLLMLDTASYFDSRWTSAEFGRAQAKGIAILRVGWPNLTPSRRVLTAERVDLLPEEIESSTGRLEASAVRRIADALEVTRSKSIAVRRTNLVSVVRDAIVSLGGEWHGVGAHGVIHAQLPDGRKITVYPATGIPTSEALFAASESSPREMCAVAYDHIGIGSEWVRHLDWLEEKVMNPRWIKAAEARWRMAEWEAPR